eukprot:CAMPEP_0180503380 /NCGR_PEP_ID=MMETSP1036_2-20121128/46007_1 /TAXON_ID=632150 /ORGANISM="Azadinium spinosum, Strain 3D9" /LENGTH=198 /DNA_ID=CAMNT_0022512415 /DNA_START=55 /DNA_END=648 /DNA_ORIENTATION=-
MALALPRPLRREAAMQYVSRFGPHPCGAAVLVARPFTCEPRRTSYQADFASPLNAADGAADTASFVPMPPPVGPRAASAGPSPKCRATRKHDGTLVLSIHHREELAGPGAGTAGPSPGAYAWPPPETAPLAGPHVALTVYRPLPHSELTAAQRGVRRPQRLGAEWEAKALVSCMVPPSHRLRGAAAPKPGIDGGGCRL